MKNVVLRIFVLVVILLSIFFATWRLLTRESRNPYPDDPSPAPPAATAPTAPNPVNTTTAAPTSASYADTTAQPTQEPASTSSATQQEQTTAAAQQEPSTEQEEMKQNIEIMAKAVNTAKSTKNFTAQKVQKVDFKITECDTIAKNVVISAGNKILQRFAHDNTKDYTFVNGISPNPKKGEPDVTPAEALPPTNMDFTLDPAGLKSLEVTQQGDNTVYTAVIAEEVVTLDNLEPKYHAMAIDYLTFDDRDMTGLTMKEVEITYQDATIEVTVGKDGSLQGYRQLTPIVSKGKMTVVGFDTQGTVVGSLDESWSFVW